MVVTCCPTSSTVDETSFALQFATRARRIAIAPGIRSSADVRNAEETCRALKSEFKKIAAQKAKIELQLEDERRDWRKQQLKAEATIDAQVKSMEALKHGVRNELEGRDLLKNRLEARLKRNSDVARLLRARLEDAVGPEALQDIPDLAEVGMEDNSKHSADIPTLSSRAAGTKEVKERGGSMERIRSFMPYTRASKTRLSDRDSSDKLAPAPSRRVPSPARNSGSSFNHSGRATTHITPLLKRSNPPTTVNESTKLRGVTSSRSSGSIGRGPSISTSRPSSPNPEERRAEAAKKHAARMRAVRNAGSKKWGYSV